MHNVLFYKNAQGVEPVAEYVRELAAKSDKDSRIKLNKIRDYVKALSIHGLQLGEPYIKHIEGEIWELRPLRDRIFFVTYQNNSFVLLHCFLKRTQKTPKREIAKAKRELRDIKERGLCND